MNWSNVKGRRCLVPDGHKPYLGLMLTALSPGWSGRAFRWFVDRILNRHFERILIEPQGPIPCGPLLVLANHVGWWDAFLVHRINQVLFRHRYHVLMLEPELSKQPFFRRMGAFSWHRGDRAEALKGVGYAAGLLTDPSNLVLIFPQGEIRSQYLDRVRFGSAARWIARRAGPAVKIVFVSMLLDYALWSRPTATLRWAVDTGEGGCRLADRFNSFLASAKERQVAAT